METQLDEEDPGLDGPDYVALVIEWDVMSGDPMPVEEIDVEEPTRPIHRQESGRWVAGAIGALAALAIARWGIHRLLAA